MEPILPSEEQSSVKSENEKEKFFSRDEVVIHNKIEDLWYIINQRVVDLTTLFKHHSKDSPMYFPMEQLLAYGGKDISHFFHANYCPKTRITVQGKLVPILAATIDEVSKLNSSEDNLIPWYNDLKYVKGQSTTQDRRIRIINTLIASTIVMTVCEEDTINDIMERYLYFNSNAKNYLWKRWSSDGSRTVGLDMSKTLTENKIIKDEYGDILLPAIWLYYVDELTGYLDGHAG